MGRLDRISFGVVLGAALLLPVTLHSQDAQSSSSNAKQQDDKSKKQDSKQKQKSLRQLEKELATPYKKWLEEEVLYIITPDERTAFLQLQTNEERESYIEGFWQRRNPDPDSAENTFKEEHYRRIAYANEHFSSGIPGWKTDRGRIYIIWGKADEVDTHPTGGPYERPPEEGGGETSTYAFETWRYRYMEGIGENIILEFVDPSGSGEYHLTMDPSEKDALLHVPGAGLTDLEAMGLASQTDRFTRTDGTHLGTALFTPASMDEFNRIEQFAKVQQAPPVKFKDLEAIVSSRLIRDQLPFDSRFDFLRVTGDTTLVPITFEVPNKALNFKNTNGVYSATLDIFARITSVGGRVVQTFEDPVHVDTPQSLFERTLKGSSVYQKTVPLRPGLYKLDVVIKDVVSGNVGVKNLRLDVQPFDEDKLQASTLILADDIEPVSTKEVGVGQFVIGSTKVRPKLDQAFHSDQDLGLYFQLYNIKVDDKTHKNDVTFNVKVTQGDKQISNNVLTSDQLHQNGEEVTFQQTGSLRGLAPGKYHIEIQATDQLAKQSVTRATDFSVTPPITISAAQKASGR